MTGAGTTVTVTIDVTIAPAPFVTVSVYVVVEAGVIVFGVPDVTAPTPLSTLPLPLENTAVSVVDVPAVMVLCAAVNEVMLGGGTTVTVALANAIVPAA